LLLSREVRAMKWMGAAVILLIAAGLVAVGLGQGTTVFGQSETPPGNMGSGGMMSGMGMMGGPFAPSARPLSLARAEQILRQWPAAHHLDGLVLDEVEAYTENFYGQFKERSTGRGAIQVLVDRYTGQAMPEMGPNMMWNAKYGRAMMQAMMDGMGMTGGMMGPGMMGGGGMMGGETAQGTTAAASQLSEAQARDRKSTRLNSSH